MKYTYSYICKAILQCLNLNIQVFNAKYLNMQK